MGDRLSGKVALVTGGASGMGRAGVVRFLDEGARVVVADLNEDNGKQLITELEAEGHGESVRFVHADVSDEADIEASVATATQDFGRLDIVWNNAGLGGALGPITEVSVEDWDFTFAVMVRGVFLGTKHAARVLRKQGTGGSIINTASIAGTAGGLGPHAYSASKAAVINFTMTTAVELGPERIRANSILPGGILTPLMHGGNPEKAAGLFVGLQPLPEVGEVDDIANAAVFLASDESRFITGASIRVDGGLMAVGAKVWGSLTGSKQISEISGVNRGTTGQPSEVRQLDRGSR